MFCWTEVPVIVLFVESYCCIRVVRFHNEHSDTLKYATQNINIMVWVTHIMTIYIYRSLTVAVSNTNRKIHNSELYEKSRKRVSAWILQYAHKKILLDFMGKTMRISGISLNDN